MKNKKDKTTSVGATSAERKNKFANKGKSVDNSGASASAKKLIEEWKEQAIFSKKEVEKLVVELAKVKAELADLKKEAKK